MNRTVSLTQNSLIETLAKYIGIKEARQVMSTVFVELDIDANKNLTQKNFETLVGVIEKRLGTEVGEAMARAVITDGLEIKQEDIGRFYQSFNRMRRQLIERQHRAHNLNEELTRLKELYENVSDSIPIGLCSMDMELKVTAWNKAMESLTNIRSKDAVNSAALDLLPEYKSLITQALHKKNIIRDRKFIRILDSGNKKFESVTVSPLKDNYEIMRGLVVSVQDVTKSIELEEQMIRAEKLASVGLLAAGVAHEVGNPLTSISILVQELVANGKVTSDKDFHSEALTLIGHHIKRITSILNNLVDYSRMKDSGMVACSLHEIVEKATPLLKLGEKGASVKLQIEIPENLPEIRCNPDQIQQVLVNLLFNAADAIMRQGSILLSVSFSNPLYVTISIKDSGCGMSDEVLRQAFNPFFTTKPIGKGTGLGLYVCYNILENQNSKLIINSNPGKGTEVKFDLEVA